ncbi:MAG: hypothetical protein IJ496_06590 [Ruminococcus sp.]|nr:hypothetical protein [Ruminococcus sp.]
MNEIGLQDVLSSMVAYHEGGASLPEASRCANAIIQLLQVVQCIHVTAESDTYECIYHYLDMKANLLAGWASMFHLKKAENRRLWKKLSTFDYAFLGYDSPEKYWKTLQE